MTLGTWEVMSRCLQVLAQLQHAPASKQELLRFYDGADPEKQFENDLKRLRDHFQVRIQYDPSEKVYRLYELGDLSLFELSPQALKGLNFLLKSFPLASPHYWLVKDLLEVVRLRLPTDQVRKLERSQTLALELRQTDTDLISDRVFALLERAHHERCMIEFEYRSPQRRDGGGVIHEVQPRHIYFDSVRGHYYLRAFCETSRSQKGTHYLSQYYVYRIGRIVEQSLQVLPKRFPIHPPSAPHHEVCYWLSATIARYGVSQHFENSEIEQHEDSSVTVTAATDDIFSAARALLYYGPNCRVLGGEALLTEFRRLVMATATLYENDAF